MTYDDSIFAAATQPSQNQGGVATLQKPPGSTPSRMPPAVSPASTPVGSPAGVPISSPASPASSASSLLAPQGGDDLWSQLINEYGKVDESFDTSAYDKAAETEYGNISTRADQAANAAAADYTNRARQAGGSAEGSGLIKAEATVAGRREVADARMKQLQYDIQQKENARTLAANIASQIGGLRMDYLKNLTQKQIAELQASTQKYGYDTEAKWHAAETGLGYAQLGAQQQQFSWLHPSVTRNPIYNPYAFNATSPTGYGSSPSGIAQPGTNTQFNVSYYPWH